MILTGEIANFLKYGTHFIAKSLAFHFFTELDFHLIKF